MGSSEAEVRPDDRNDNGQRLTVLVLVEDVVDLSLDLIHSSGHFDCCCVWLMWFLCLEEELLGCSV